ncbi:unnamed protein product, partial [Polarella glacialis]
VQALRETCPPPITLTSFMDGSLPALTLFEICARVGSGNHLRELRRSAQRRPPSRRLESGKSSELKSQVDMTRRTVASDRPSVLLSPDTSTSTEID